MIEGYDSMDRHNKLIWNLWDIGHTMRHISEGKGSQKRVLMTLLESEDMTQRELTNRLDIQPGSASEVIGKLEASGFLVRSPSEADRRTTNIALTEAGKAAAGDALAQRRKRHQQMFASLSEAEKDTLLHLLEKVNADWDTRYRQSEAETKSPNCRKGRGHQRHKRHKEI